MKRWREREREREREMERERRRYEETKRVRDGKMGWRDKQR